MGPDDFRRLALAFPGVIEASHMGHPDFRVGKRIFATLGFPSDEWAMVKLSPDQQALVVATQPELFRPVKGAWGTKGSTNVNLGAADEASVANALRLAWQAVSETAMAASSRKTSSAPRGASKRSNVLDWEKVTAHALSLEGAELATHYGHPAVKVNGRALISVGREEGSLALHIDMETKELLIENAPLTYWQTAHYEGWPTVLVRYDTPDREHVLAMVTRVWQQARSLGHPRTRKPANSVRTRRQKGNR